MERNTQTHTPVRTGQLRNHVHQARWEMTQKEGAHPNKANAVSPLSFQLSRMHLWVTLTLGDTKDSLKDILVVIIPGFVHLLDICSI